MHSNKQSPGIKLLIDRRIATYDRGGIDTPVQAATVVLLVSVLVFSVLLLTGMACLIKRIISKRQPLKSIVAALIAMTVVIFMSSTMYYSLDYLININALPETTWATDDLIVSFRFTVQADQ